MPELLPMMRFLISEAAEVMLRWREDSCRLQAERHAEKYHL